MYFMKVSLLGVFPSYVSNVSIYFLSSSLSLLLCITKCPHIIYLLSQHFATLLASQLYHPHTPTRGKGCICHAARYLLGAHLLGTSHLPLASSVSHLTHPALSCPRGAPRSRRPRWPLPVRSELRFPDSLSICLSLSLSVSVYLCVRLFAFVALCRGFFHEFSLSFPRAAPFDAAS